MKGRSTTLEALSCLSAMPQFHRAVAKGGLEVNNDMRLRDLFDALVYEGQQTIVVLDDLMAEGTAGDLHAMFNEEVLSSKVKSIDAVEGCVLKVFATLVEEDAHAE